VSPNPPSGTHAIPVLGVLGVAVALLFAASLLVGPASLPPRDALAALLAGGDEPMALVMREIRLPRALLGLLIGAGLGMSGAALQGYLRNPLAEPGLLGISGAAALGAVLALYTGLSLAFPLALPLAALAGAVGATLLLRALAGRSPGSITLILAGIALSSLAAALTSLVLNLSPNPFAAAEIIYWLLGSLADRSMLHVWLAAPFILAGIAALARLGRALDALTLGEDTAASLGVDLGRTRALAVAGTALSVGAGVAVAGAIGFVGLVVPHLLRPFTGAMPSRLLPASALGGAALLLLADLAVRLVAPDRDLKLGVLTALVGAPFFFWLVLRHRRELT
jgi:iron complex transport system permease protein